MGFCRHGLQGYRHKQRILRSHRPDSGQGSGHDTFPSLFVAQYHNSHEDSMLLRFIRHHDSYQDQRGERYETRVVQQDSYPSSGFLLTGTKGRHHSQDEWWYKWSGEFHNEHPRYASEESYPDYLLHGNIDHHQLAAHGIHHRSSPVADLAHECTRKDIEEEITSGSGTLERHHVPARRDFGRTPCDQGVRGRGQDADEIQQRHWGREEENGKSRHQAGIGPSYERIPRHRPHRDCARIRRSHHPQRESVVRRTDLHFLHGHPV